MKQVEDDQRTAQWDADHLYPAINTTNETNSSEFLNAIKFAKKSGLLEIVRI